jgi:hypothetical protein
MGFQAGRNLRSTCDYHRLSRRVAGGLCQEIRRCSRRRRLAANDLDSSSRPEGAGLIYFIIIISHLHYQSHKRAYLSYYRSCDKQVAWIHGCLRLYADPVIHVLLDQLYLHMHIANAKREGYRYNLLRCGPEVKSYFMGCMSTALVLFQSRRRCSESALVSAHRSEFG